MQPEYRIKLVGPALRKTMKWNTLKFEYGDTESYCVSCRRGSKGNLRKLINSANKHYTDTGHITLLRRVQTAMIPSQIKISVEDK